MESPKRRYLEFERPLQELDSQILRLKDLPLQGRVDVSNEIMALEAKREELLRSTFSKLEPYQIVQLARHPDRPNTLEYFQLIFTDFLELSGDRNFADDKSIVGGLARLNGDSVVVIGHQKGRSTQENMQRNFGMPKPEGYRKAKRLMDLAERFRLPIITLVDTPGAYPGLEAEERGQATAIAENLLRMCELKVPLISVVIGEGGSGGALALAIADRLLMLEFSVYSVISPEGCASIVWKDAAFTARAAEALRLTASEIHRFGIADRVLSEPLGGAHRDAMGMAATIQKALKEELSHLKTLSSDQLRASRYEKYRKLGPYLESVA